MSTTKTNETIATKTTVHENNEEIKKTTTDEKNIPKSKNNPPKSKKKENDYENIDAACNVVAKAYEDRYKAVCKATEDAVKKQEEIDRNNRIERTKAIRATRKKKAKNMTFWMAIVSAVCSTCIFGILVWLAFRPNALMFATVMCVIGMLNTILHTYVYRYIREAIYRK